LGERYIGDYSRAFSSPDHVQEGRVTLACWRSDAPVFETSGSFMA
jgi:hypothetical protein